MKGFRGLNDSLTLANKDRGMNEVADSPPRPSEVAMWHRLSGLPDNVTDAGDIVEVDAGRRLSAEKALLRASIAELERGRDG